MKTKWPIWRSAIIHHRWLRFQLLTVDTNLDESNLEWRVGTPLLFIRYFAGANLAGHIYLNRVLSVLLIGVFCSILPRTKVAINRAIKIST